MKINELKKYDNVLLSVRKPWGISCDDVDPFNILFVAAYEVDIDLAIIC